MIKENNFYIDNLKNVVFLGEHASFEQLIKINQSLNLNTKVVTSQDQSQLLKKKIKFKIFNSLDKDFKKFITNEFKIEETLFISIKGRWIFKKEMIKEFFKFNLINYHPSRLPLYAGGASDSWRIMKEDRIDCRIFHLVNETIDGGPIIIYEKSVLPRECRLPIDLQNFSNKKIITLYKNFIKLLNKKRKFPLNKQSTYLGQYYPRLLDKTNGWIDWNLSTTQLSRFINAFDNPHLGASTMINNQRVYLKKAQLHGGEQPNHPHMSGLISRHEVNWIVVCTNDENTLIVEEVLDEKKENIIKKIKVGERFYTPENKILLSKSYKPKLGTKGFKK